MKIDILTVTLGRDLYLKKLLNSLDTSGISQLDYRHYIIYQGNPTDDIITNIKCKNKTELIINNQGPISIGQIMNQFKSKCGDGLFWKIDDDAEFISKNMNKHIEELYTLKPNCVFSPYPVGLINNPGGVMSKEHEVIYSQKLDQYYTLRKVNHVGGFCRIMPSNIYKNIEFTDSHSEDGEVSLYCRYNNIPMYYLENSLIVEHQESTLGQHKRYGNNYFKGRF